MTTQAEQFVSELNSAGENEKIKLFLKYNGVATLKDDKIKVKFPDDSTAWITEGIAYLDGNDPLPHNNQANAFTVLMEMLWEGGAAYDLRLEPDNLPIHNACHLARSLFPKTWAAKTCIAAASDECEGHYILTFPDKSQLLIYESGSETEFIG